jgi:hypothetical protein
MKDNIFMNKTYPTSTNWAPWLAIAFILSGIFFGMVSDWRWLVLLLLLSFFPTLIVALTLRGYFMIDNNQLKYFYRRRKNEKPRFAVSLVDIYSIRRVGKSVIIHYGEGDDHFMRRVHDAAGLTDELTKLNPAIKLVLE